MHFLITQILCICLAACGTAIAMDSKTSIEIHSTSELIYRSGRDSVIRSQRKNGRKFSTIVADGMTSNATWSPDNIGTAALMSQDREDPDDEPPCQIQISGRTCTNIRKCDSSATCVGYKPFQPGKCQCSDGMCAVGSGRDGKCEYAKINCKWSQWEEWTPCDYSCGSGDRSRMREVERGAEYGGTQCDGPAEETETCHEEECPTTTTMKVETTTTQAVVNEVKLSKGQALYLYLWLLCLFTPVGPIAFCVCCGLGIFVVTRKKKKPIDEFGEEDCGEDYDHAGEY